jgi:hypothetical protein
MDEFLLSDEALADGASAGFSFHPKFSSWLVATWAGSGALQSQIVDLSGR